MTSVHHVNTAGYPGIAYQPPKIDPGILRPRRRWYAVAIALSVTGIAIGFVGLGISATAGADKENDTGYVLAAFGFFILIQVALFGCVIWLVGIAIRRKSQERRLLAESYQAHLTAHTWSPPS